MIKIQVPLNSHSHLPELLRLGGDEFYMGYLPAGARDLEQVISRRPGLSANPGDRQWTARQIALIKKAGKLAFVTFNAHFYPPGTETKILEAMSWLVEQGLDGVILADPGLLQLLRQEFPWLQYLASAALAVTNSAAARFFHEQGFTRIILPRQLSILEIRQLATDNPGLEFEVFVKNDECPNLDGLCCYAHGSPGGNSFGQACRRLKPAKKNTARRSGVFFEEACGACALFDLKDLELAACKIVGRDKPRARIEQDLFFIRSAAQLIQHHTERSVFQAVVRQLYREIYNQDCPGRCYYL